MSRSFKVGLFESLNQPKGRIPVLKKTADRRFHSHACALCIKGHRHKQKRSKIDRQKAKRFLQQEINAEQKETE